MSLTSTMFTGASGILNNAEGMSVIGNNISNVNTIGFKGSRMLFSDVLSTVIGNTSVGQIGHGVQIQKVDTLFTQGANETTTSPTDMFVQGKSFFAVAAPGTTKGPIPATGALYTRAGSFRLDTTGLNLINPDNYAVLDSERMPIRFKKDSTSVDAADMGVPNLPTPSYGATILPFDNTKTSATTGAYAVNDIVTINGIYYICSSVPVETTANGLTTIENPILNTTGWTRGTFDQTGTMTYAKGDIVYGSNGSRYVKNDTNAPLTVTVANSNPVADATNWDLILDFQKVLSVSTKGEISLLYSDDIGNSSTVFYNGTYDSADQALNPLHKANTQRQPVSTAPGTWVGLAQIPNPAGLIKEGSSLYRESGVVIGGSGTPVIGAPNGSTESIINSNLELSSVDLALEFVKMIQTQRAYSANSKTITTADDMMQEILNIKR